MNIKYTGLEKSLSSCPLQYFPQNAFQTGCSRIISLCSTAHVLTSALTSGFGGGGGGGGAVRLH